MPPKKNPKGAKGKAKALEKEEKKLQKQAKGQSKSKIIFGLSFGGSGRIFWGGY